MQSNGSRGDAAYAALRDRIVTLDLKPGSVISEEDLATALDMGRTPIREAIKRLAHEGLIVVLPRRGTFVSEITVTHPEEVAEVRASLEGLCARLAAKRRTEQDVAVLDGFRQELLALGQTTTVTDLISLDSRIHRALHLMAGNPLLLDTLEIYFNLALRIWHSVGVRRPDASYVLEEVAGHVALFDAIKNRDADLAEGLAARHVEDTARRLVTG